MKAPTESSDSVTIFYRDIYVVYQADPILFFHKQRVFPPYFDSLNQSIRIDSAKIKIYVKVLQMWSILQMPL